MPSRRLLVLIALIGLGLALVGGKITPLWQSPPGPVTLQGPLSWLTDNTNDFGTSATAGRPRDLFLARNAHITGFLHVQGGFTVGAHVVVIRSNGVGGSGNVEILSGLHPLYLVECLDGDGCTVQLAETSVTVGTFLRIVNISTSGSANHNLTLSDAAPLHLAGALTLAANGTVTLMYVVNRSGDGNWFELSRSAN